MTRGKLMAFIENGACAAAIGLALAAGPALAAGAAQPPHEGCIAITKHEYNSAKREKLLRNRYGAYVRTGRILRRFYWYCHE